MNQPTQNSDPLSLEGFTTSDILNLFLKHLEEEHKISRDKVLKRIDEERKEIRIPISIFSKKLSALETITKYLIENLGLKNSAAAKLLNRDIRTIWTTHKNAQKKCPDNLDLSHPSNYSIPASRFTNRAFSVLEVIVSYLKDNYKLSLHEIAILLARDDSTIWTVYSRSKKKGMIQK